MTVVSNNVAPCSIDTHIGQRIQLRRNIMGLTQEQLAASCQVSFQQIQKYEKAANRISASRLFKISQALDTPVSFFFSGLPQQNSAMNIFSDKSSKSQSNVYFAHEPSPDDPFAKNESLEIIKLYWNLPSDALRDNVMSLLRSMNGEVAKSANTSGDDTSAV
ncbi:transcriptional regulator [Bacteroidia bacterium]|nr:transcriptional regulator [Bacteroidia bacterium]